MRRGMRHVAIISTDSCTNAPSFTQCATHHLEVAGYAWSLRRIAQWRRPVFLLPACVANEEMLTVAKQLEQETLRLAATRAFRPSPSAVVLHLRMSVVASLPVLRCGWSDVPAPLGAHPTSRSPVHPSPLLAPFFPSPSPSLPPCPPSPPRPPNLRALPPAHPFHHDLAWCVASLACLSLVPGIPSQAAGGAFRDPILCSTCLLRSPMKRRWCGRSLGSRRRSQSAPPERVSN